MATQFGRAVEFYRKLLNKAAKKYRVLAKTPFKSEFLPKGAADETLLH